MGVVPERVYETRLESGTYEYRLHNDDETMIVRGCRVAGVYAMVDSALAERFWPGDSALGKRVYYGVDVEDATPFFTVVGVVAAHVMRGPDDAVGTCGSHFIPFAQSTFSVERLTFCQLFEPWDVLPCAGAAGTLAPRCQGAQYGAQAQPGCSQRRGVHALGVSLIPQRSKPRERLFTANLDPYFARR